MTLALGAGAFAERSGGEGGRDGRATTRSRRWRARVGLNVDIKPTPSIALGAYEVTPLEIAGAYTVFPNGGQLVNTSFIKSHPRPAEPHDFPVAAEAQAGHRSARGLSGREHDGRSAPHRAPARRLRAADSIFPLAARHLFLRRRQDRHLARRLVRGLHFQADHRNGRALARLRA